MDIQKYVGIPYELHGRDEGGCDCYGLVLMFYRDELGITLPDFSYNEESDLLALYKEQLNKWIQTIMPMKGDVIYLRLAGQSKHVGVMIDENNFIHNRKGSSTIGNVRDSQWKKRIIGYYRYA